jgi:signal transduction histidine kinase
MKRPLNRGRRRFRYAKSQPHLWESLERFHAMNLRLAGFLHQFKTPLHVIQSQAELLLDDSALAPNLRKSIELMHLSERIRNRTHRAASREYLPYGRN